MCDPDLVVHSRFFYFLSHTSVTALKSSDKCSSELEPQGNFVFRLCWLWWLYQCLRAILRDPELGPELTFDNLRRRAQIFDQFFVYFVTGASLPELDRAQESLSPPELDGRAQGP